MQRRIILLSGVLVVLALIYAMYFTDWFAEKTIQIIPQIRPVRVAVQPSNLAGPMVCPVSFLLDGEYSLTEIKVVAADDLRTNKYPMPLWHMVAKERTRPVNSFWYGQRIRGMRPAIPRARARPLEPNVEYIIQLRAGDITGQTNFHTRVYTPPQM